MAERVETLDPSLSLRLSDYDYPLPRERIARYPLEQRDQARMMLLDRRGGGIAHRRFSELPDMLQPGDRVVLNNTRVLPARVMGHREGQTGKVEILFLHPDPDTADPACWVALKRPGRKLHPGTRVEIPGLRTWIEILAEGPCGRGRVRVHLQEFETVERFLDGAGRMPIPHYLGREAEPSDAVTYQTVFAKVPGAQAAPTAGLHFTPEVLERLAKREIGVSEITMAVGTGTFRRVEAKDITHHRMDPEYYTLPAETAAAIEETRRQGGRVIAVGTTVAKTLETVAPQFGGRLCADDGWSRLFIYPGFRFQVVDGLLTNFHLPKTTLLMLVSAFSDRETLLDAYRQAVQEGYRFFSYGDCMLIL